MERVHLNSFENVDWTDNVCVCGEAIYLNLDSHVFHPRQIVIAHNGNQAGFVFRSVELTFGH